MPLLLVSLGAFGIFASAGIAAGLAVAASLYFMRRAFGHRLSPVVRMSVVRHVLSFSAATYISSLFNLFPLLLVPLIVLDRDGAADAGYYFVAFQLASLLYAVSYAVAESLLAEGSHPETSLRRLAQRSAVLVGIFTSAGAVVLAAGSHLILLLFGRDYSDHASVAFAILALSAPAVALNTWASTLLKVTKQLSAMIVSNIVYTVVIVGLVWLWARQGLGSVALAWLYGNLVSGCHSGRRASRGLVAAREPGQRMAPSIAPVGSASIREPQVLGRDKRRPGAAASGAAGIARETSASGQILKDGSVRPGLGQGWAASGALAGSSSPATPDPVGGQCWPGDRRGREECPNHPRRAPAARA